MRHFGAKTIVSHSHFWRQLLPAYFWIRFFDPDGPYICTIQTCDFDVIKLLGNLTQFRQHALLLYHKKVNYADCHYAEYHYADCHHAVCGGANKLVRSHIFPIPQWKIQCMMKDRAFFTKGKLYLKQKNSSKVNYR